jgi:hypothetical protein
MKRLIPVLLCACLFYWIVAALIIVQPRNVSAGPVLPISYITVDATPFLGLGMKSFNAQIISDTQVDLAWTTDPSVMNVIVKAKNSTMPISRTDGYEVYQGPLSNFSDTSMNFDLNTGTITYRIWAQNGAGVWLDNEVFTQTMEAPIMQTIAIIIFTLGIIGMALWQRSNFLWIIAGAVAVAFGSYWISLNQNFFYIISGVAVIAIGLYMFIMVGVNLFQSRKGE